MNILIVGYGKMGKTIEKLALEKGHTVVAKIDAEEDWILYREEIGAAHIAVEFSQPAAAVKNIRKCFGFNIPVVSGTTGWDDDLETVVKECIDKGQTLFVASNFSIGMNIFFRLNRYLAEIMDKFEGYDVSIDETHHLQKLDAPSGTAKSLAADLIKKIGRKQNWKSDERTGKEDIRIDAHRVADVNGIHQVSYHSGEDIIQIRHEAKSRQGFAAGALMAAAWVEGKKGFFTMNDLFDELI